MKSHGSLLVVGAVLLVLGVQQTSAQGDATGAFGPTSCSSDTEWRCYDGQCIPKGWVCNEMRNCRDGSDENATICSTLPCEFEQFDCRSSRGMGKRKCIAYSYLCDGSPDCPEGEDEEGCNCDMDSEFMCRPHECIPKIFECDRIKDCESGIDEHANCTYAACDADSFMCKDFENCIPAKSKCDGKRDCGDNSDEDEKLCAKPTTCENPDDLMCHNGQCINYRFACNGDDDCGDLTDETDCGVFECKNATLNKCEHECEDTVVSFHCKCRPGYELQKDKYSCKDINECTANPRKCSQLCTNSPGSFSCSCANGFTLDNDNTTCRSAKAAKPYLIFANKYFIRRVDFNGANYDILTDANQHSHVLDYDYINGFIYFADAQLRVIKRMLMDGTNITTLTEMVERRSLIEGISVDWVNQKLYWTDSRLEAIFVSEVNGTNVKMLYLGTPHPRAIAVLPDDGTLFWTDWNLKPFIAKMGMDGSDMQKVVTTGIFWPNALTLDSVTRRMWWADAYLDVIESSDFDGGNRHLVLSGTPHIYAISIFEELMIWVDWNIRIIEKANRFTGANRTTILTLPLQPYDIHVVHPSQQPSLPNPCGQNNGGCSHLCLLAPGNGQFSCACPEHFILDTNNKTCKANCSGAQFECGRADHRCIPKYWVCDGENDCKNGEDEAVSCAPRTCPSGVFQCGNNNCVSFISLCDGNNDCQMSGAGSDEDPAFCTNRTCLPYEFKCDSGKCIPDTWVCDEENDCGDSSDENLPRCKEGAAECKDEEFRCNNSKCIPKVWTCDLDDDCGDGSDEPRHHCWTQPCSDGWHRCKTNYRCIPKLLHCDGDDDCRDNSDEDPSTCPACDVLGDFQCANDQCIPKRWKCDFEDDCGDGSDELEEMCAKEAPNCTEVEFRCKNRKCIQLKFKCNHNDDCGDDSDEGEELCKDPNFTCAPGKFQCRSGHCVDEDFTCDGERDCQDGSDEEQCPTRYPGGRYCDPDKFECDNHVCISTEWQCDGENDCGDSSDEITSRCTNRSCNLQTHFRCDGIKCIHRRYLCDKVKNCDDGSDENDFSLSNCSGIRPCNATEFRCGDRKCIPMRQVCDEAADCADHSDEIGCNKTGMCETGRCQHNCTNLQPIGHYCSCREGYTVSPEDRTRCIDINECANFSLNYCPQKCVPLRGMYTCDCELGFERTAYANHHVQCDPVRGLGRIYLMAVEDSVRQLRPNLNIYRDAVMSGRKVHGLDVDTRNRLIYWTDPLERQVFRARVPTSPADVALPQSMDVNTGKLVSPDGIAYDWVNKMVYIADPGAFTIFVMGENGTYFKTLLPPMQSRTPTGIVVSPAQGLMFWTNPAVSKIESAWMNGAHVETVISKDLGEPLGLAIDHYMDNRLYWTDAKFNTIETAKHDGTDRHIVIKTGSDRPFHLDVIGLNLVWSSSSSGHVYTQDKFGRGVNISIVSGRQEILTRGVKGFQEVEKYDTKIPNRCDGLVKRCWPMCLLIPNGAVCACPDGSYFKDQENTKCDTVKETPKPYPRSCHCENGGTCTYTDRGEPICTCIGDYRGRRCSIPPPPTLYPPSPAASDKNASDSKTSPAVIVVPIILILLLLLMVLAMLFFLYRKGVLLNDKSKLRQGHFRPGAPGAGGTMGIENQLYEESSTPSPNVHYSVDDGVTRISNPLYETLHAAPERENISGGKLNLDTDANANGSASRDVLA